MELDDVELGLAGGKACELGCDGFRFRGEEVVAVASDGDKGGAGCCWRGRRCRASRVP